LGDGEKMKKNSVQELYCFYLIFCISVLTVSCLGNPEVNSFRADRSLKIAVPVQHLVFIGLDGWGGYYVSNANMPTVKRMIANGASSRDVRCVMPSISWPNWTSLFFSAAPEHRTSEQFPSIFTLVKNSGQENMPVFFYEWEELDKICSDETADKLEILSDLESALEIAAYFIEKKPVFTAIVFNEPDHIGHIKTWGSRAYYAKLTELDGFIAIIEQAVKDTDVYDSTVFVISADHGGSFWGHGFNLSSHRKTPLIIFGKGIKEGYVIPSPISICDIAPTMAAILGLEAPLEWTGNTLTDIFR
jgi:predicted AlkP superfamily pyrophosphatase or phosphodiesterase